MGINTNRITVTNNSLIWGFVPKPTLEEKSSAEKTLREGAVLIFSNPEACTLTEATEDVKEVPVYRLILTCNPEVSPRITPAEIPPQTAGTFAPEYDPSTPSIDRTEPSINSPALSMPGPASVDIPSSLEGKARNDSPGTLLVIKKVELQEEEKVSFAVRNQGPFYLTIKGVSLELNASEISVVIGCVKISV